MVVQPVGNLISTVVVLKVRSVEEKILTKNSKYLSKLLRHNPEKVNLRMSVDGWVSVRQLLANTKFTMDMLESVVENNNKKRFEFNDDKTRIRARQGHSIKVDLKYDEAIPPKYLYHGTAKQNFFGIWWNGLRKMKRHHVHLSPDEQTAIKIGQRHGIPICLKVEAKQMHDVDFKFYKTENDVWLVDNVPSQYIIVDGIGVEKRLGEKTSNEL